MTMLNPTSDWLKPETWKTGSLVKTKDQVELLSVDEVLHEIFDEDEIFLVLKAQWETEFNNDSIFVVTLLTKRGLYDFFPEDCCEFDFPLEIVYETR